MKSHHEELYYNRLFNRFRYRVATIIAKWVERMLREMNVQSRVPGAHEESSDEEVEPSSESEDKDEMETPASNGRTADREVDEDGREEESQGDSPDEQLTPPSADENPSSSQEESEGDSPDEQRMELTPPSEDEQGEGSSSTLVKSASTGKVAAVQSEQGHVYSTRSRAELLQNKSSMMRPGWSRKRC